MAKLRIKKRKWVFIFLFIPGILFLFWKTKYGYGASDEPFYLTVSHRLLKNDGLIVDEWNLSQLSGALLYPVMKLYHWIHPTTEGILLHMRYAYCMMQILTSLSICYRLRKYGCIAYLAANFYLLFAPYNIMALSYNTMGIACIVLCGIILSTYEKAGRGQVILAGFLFSMAVLCTPHLVFLYAGLTFLMMIEFVYKKVRKPEKSLLQLPFSWFYISIGCGIGALLLIGFLFSRADFDELLKALPFMLQDSDHSPVGIKRAIKTYLLQNWIYFRKYILLQLSCIIFLLLNRKNNKLKYVPLQFSVLFCFLQLLFLATKIQETYNFILYPIAWVGFLAFLMLENKNWKLFFWGYFLGLGYTFTLNWSSNQGIFAITTGTVLVDLCSILFLWQVIQERKEKDKIRFPLQNSLILVLLLTQMLTLVYSKAVHVFWEPPVSELTAKVEEGPLKGIYTTEANADHYKMVLKDLTVLRDMKEGNVLLIGFDTWGYLAVDMPYGTYSAWSGGESEHTLSRLASYYELNPEKIPAYIYLPKISAWTTDEILNLLQLKDYEVNQQRAGYILKKITNNE